MKSTSTLALIASLGLGLTLAVPAAAQKAESGANKAAAAQEKKAIEAPVVAGGRKYDVSKEARKPLSALQAALTANDAAAFAAALAAAEAAAKTPDDRYLIAQMRLNQAVATADENAQVAALDAMVRSGSMAEAEIPKAYSNMAALHQKANRLEEAGAALQKLMELRPNDATPMVQLAELRVQQKRPTDAVALLDRAIALSKAAGQNVPETWYRRALKFAYEGKLPQANKLSRELAQAYPSETNWSDAINIYRQTAQLDKAATLDLFRLMRAAKLIKIQGDVFDYANALHESGYPGEAKAVLDEAVARGLIKSSSPGFKDLISVTAPKIAADRASLSTSEKQAASAVNGRTALNTADAFFGYGDYAKAAALYRTALTKGGVDTNLVNTRLGMALGLAGQRAEAEAALKAVTGARADVAALWLLWLSNRG